MKTSSCKAKGRTLQKLVVAAILARFKDFTEHDVISTSMGKSGVDVQLSEYARKNFGYSIECKNVEKLNLWQAWEQAIANAKDLTPLLVVKRNNIKPLVVLTLEHFMSLYE